MSAFLPDRCVVGRDMHVSVDDLWAGWKAWAEDQSQHHAPASGTFTPTGRMSGVRGATEGLLLPDGRVLVLPMRSLSRGSPGPDGPGGAGPGAAETYGPTSGTFTVWSPRT